MMLPTGSGLVTKTGTPHTGRVNYTNVIKHKVWDVYRLSQQWIREGMIVSAVLQFNQSTNGVRQHDYTVSSQVESAGEAAEREPPNQGSLYPFWGTHPKAVDPCPGSILLPLSIWRANEKRQRDRSADRLDPHTNFITWVQETTRHDKDYISRTHVFSRFG